MSSEPDPAFKAVPKGVPFFLIWRIEKLQVVPVPKDQHGTFYSGDSYIVACGGDAKDRNDPNFKPRDNVILPTHIHFWLGSETSQDEAGIAAYKTVELDDYLGGYPIQYREQQGHESKRFLSYFRGGIKILEGGVASGFNHVENITKPRLFQVKGKRIPVVKECHELSWASVNTGDVFILDAGSYVFLWSGREANKSEKIQGILAAQQFKTSHGPQCNAVVLVDDGKEEDDLAPDEKKVFETYLPLDQKDSLINNEPTSDAETNGDDYAEMKRRSNLKLYRCSDESGSLRIEHIKDGPLKQDDLKSEDTFIIDSGESGVWCWIGKKASQLERVEGMRNAHGFVKKKGYPNHVPVTRVIDGGEPLEFKSLFSNWKEPNQTVGLGQTFSFGGRVAKIAENKFDPSTLHENQKLAAELQMIDDGTGQKQVYRVKDFDLHEVDSKDYGTFFTGDCYLIVYKSKNTAIVYYWIGNEASVDERGTAALKTIEIDDKQFNGSAVQIRVVEGKEPPHFTALFDGKMVVFKGGFQSGFRQTDQDSDNEMANGNNYLLQVRGTNKYVTRAIEVECKASSLNSNDVFVLQSTKAVYIWAGKGSTGDEREMAKQLASRSAAKEQNLVSEGSEKDDFWDAIGGKEEYSSGESLYNPIPHHPPRLFQCSNAKGYFTVEEIVDFQQTDLIEDDVMLLDAGDTIFLWIGEQSNDEERKFSRNLVAEYMKTDPSQRDEDTPLIIIKQGYEPPNFTGFFGAWNKNMWKKMKSYEDVKKDLKDVKASVLKAIPKDKSPDLTGEFDASSKYPFEVLSVRDAMELPEGVDPSRREAYLSNEDFIKLFGMSYNEFQSLPRWRQMDMKKRVGLF